MKIAILTTEDPLYLPKLFDELFKRHHKDIGLVVFLTNSIQDNVVIKRVAMKNNIMDHCDVYQDSGYTGIFLKRIIDCAYQVEEKLKINLLPSISRSIKKYQVESLCVSDINSTAVEKMLKVHDLDLVLSIYLPQKIKKNILAIPKQGAINIHDSLLPEYRGLEPSFWELYNNEAKTGITVHYMNEKFDDGAIIGQSSIEIKTKVLHTLNKQKTVLAWKVLSESIELLKSGKIDPLKNDSLKSSYFPAVSLDDYKCFYAKGYKVWSALI